MVAHQPLNLNAIAGQFDMSRQAVSLHVKILTECGLVVIRQQGRERYCEAQLEGLKEVSAWVDQYKSVWTSRFSSLEKHLETVKAKNTTHDKQRPKRKQKHK